MEGKDKTMRDGNQSSNASMVERALIKETPYKSEQKLLQYLEASPEAIYVHDLKGNFLYGNRAAEKLIGYPKEELIGKSFIDLGLLPVESLTKAIHLLESSAAGKPTGPDEFELIRKDGRQISVEISTYAVGEADNFEVVGVVRDISERKRAEHERAETEVLRRMQKTMERLLDGMNDGYCVIRGYTIVFANSSAAAMFGYAQDEVVGKRLNDYLPQSIVQQLSRVYDTGLSGGIVPPQYQIALTKRNGTVCQVELGARVTVYEGKPAISIVIRDITDRKLMEKALGQKEQDYLVLLESTDENIIVVDAETLKIVFGNRRAARTFGFNSVPEALSSNLLDFIHPDDRDTVVKAFLEDPYTQERRQRYQARANTKDGKELWISALATRIEFQGRVAVLLSLKDITEQKQMEEELQQRWKDYLSLLENAYDAMVVIDVDTQQAVYGNRSAAVLFGLDYTKQEGIGLTPFDVIHSDDLEVAAKAFSNYYTYDRPQLYEVRAYTKDRSIRWVQVFATRTNWEKKPAALLTLRDITERKAMEKALGQKEQDYLVLLESTDENIIVVDAETLKIVFGNRRAARTFDFDSVPEALGSNLLDFIHPDDRDTVVKAFLEDPYTQERRQRYQARANTKDGKELWISALATRIEFQGRVAVLLSLRDITESKLIEDALRGSEQKLRLYFENVGDVIYSIDRELRVVNVSPSVENLLGYKPEELIGKAFSELNVLAPEYLEAAASDIMRVMSGERISCSEYEFITKDGRRKFGQASGAPLLSQEGTVIGLVSVARDITEQKKAEAEKQKMEEQLRIVGRLAAVGELAAGVAHELNNPLAAIQGFAQLLCSRKDIDESVRKDLDAIYREVQRAGKITKSLLSFAHKYEPARRFISINEAVEKVLELRLHQMAVNNIEVKIELDPNLPKTTADIHQIQQVFLNIINNAEQAMLDTHGKGKLVVKTRKSGNMIQITFKDDGPGIPDENIQRIFDPFFTTKGVGRGTGLGLSICHGIVQAHGGNIYAKSNPSDGATFVIEIPIVPDNITAYSSN